MTASQVSRDLLFLLARVSCATDVARGCVRLFRSHDEGTSWSAVRTPPAAAAVLSLAFADDHDGWLVERTNGRTGSVFVTHDAGVHWHRLALRSARSVAVAGGRVYLVAGRSIVASRVTNDRYVALAPSTGTTLVAQDGFVYDYDNDPRGSGRLTFTQVRGLAVRTGRLPCAHWYFSAALVRTAADGLVAVCGSEPGAGNQLKRAYASTDGGTTWRALAEPGLGGYVSLGAASGSGVFVTGGRMSLVASFDGGRSWRVRVAGSGSAGGFLGVGFADEQHGWSLDGGPPAALYVTDDGGRTWRATARP